jgi:hypothetical protein
MKKNTEISEFLNGIEKDTQEAHSEQDLLVICGKVRDFLQSGGSLRYDFTAHYIVMIVGLLAGVLFGYELYNNPTIFESLDWGAYVVIGAAALMVIVPLVMVINLGERVDDISRQMFTKDVHFDNGITPLEVSSETYDNFLERFGDFNRGDESQKIQSLCKIPVIIGGQVVDYQYYKFSYVVVTYVATPVSNGKTTTIVMRRVETTYYRYGLIGTFQWVKGIIVKNCSGGSYDYPATYNTGSNTFNKAFDVAAVSAINASKFLKPAVILAFEDIAQHINGLAIEVNKDGELCISFSDDDLIMVPQNSTLENIDEFEKQIAMKNYPGKMQKIAGFIEMLTKHNDQNF